MFIGHVRCELRNDHWIGIVSVIDELENDLVNMVGWGLIGVNSKEWGERMRTNMNECESASWVERVLDN